MTFYTSQTSRSSIKKLEHEIIALINERSSELGLKPVDVKAILKTLASQAWAEPAADDRQLSFPFINRCRNKLTMSATTAQF
jgi:hypothetical protein